MCRPANCEKRWGYTKRHCNRLIEGVAVAREVGPIGPTLATESQVRELTAVEPARRAEVVQAAAATAKAEERPMTARDIFRAGLSIARSDGAGPRGIVIS